jgi:predicted RNA binding protein YcfA (HicA-like mRNA interferase family)
VSQTPAVTGKQLIKALEGWGWYVKRIRGSHQILRHPSIPDAIPVPVHGNQPIKKGTLGNILRTAGISREQFTAETTKPPEIWGFCLKRMKGFEPSTFAMARRRSSQLSYIRVRRAF